MGALSYQITGTFNLVIAQRLCRRVRESCKVDKVSENKRRSEYWEFAKESLTSMIPEALTRELELRHIDETMWKKFFDQ